MDSRQITLIYNGEYYGVYQLYEQIRVEDGRIDIYDWEQDCPGRGGKDCGQLLR